MKSCFDCPNGWFADDVMETKCAKCLAGMSSDRERPLIVSHVMREGISLRQEGAAVYLAEQVSSSPRKVQSSAKIVKGAQPTPLKRP